MTDKSFQCFHVKKKTVSQFAVEEYEVLEDTLNQEKNLRTEAEKFARAVSFSNYFVNNNTS